MDYLVLLAVGLIFVVCIAAGYLKGFFKIGLSLLSTVITLILVIILTPYVGDALAEYTPIGEMVEQKCLEGFTSSVTGDMLVGKDWSGTALDGMTPEELQGMDGTNLESKGISAQKLFQTIGELPLEQQIQQVQSTVLPDFVKEALLENNNHIIYEELGVTTFWDYVAAYIARMLIHVVSFLVTFLLAIIIVRALMAAVDIIGELPVIGTLNHIGGAAVGAGVALIIVWIAFLLITVTYSSEFSASCLAQIQQNPILNFLYESNPLLGKLLSF